jgi:hypothetical protein
LTSVNSFGQHLNIAQLQKILLLNIENSNEYLNQNSYFFENQDNKWKELDCDNLTFGYKGKTANEVYSLIKNTCIKKGFSNNFLIYSFTEIALFNKLINQIRNTGYKRYGKNILENDYMISYYRKGKFFIRIKSGTLKSSNDKAMFHLYFTQNPFTL